MTDRPGRIARSGLVACRVATFLCLFSAQARAQAIAIPVDPPDPRLVLDVRSESPALLLLYDTQGIPAIGPSWPPPGGPNGWQVVFDGMLVGAFSGVVYAVVEDIHHGLFGDYDGRYMLFTIGGAVLGGGIGALLCLGWDCDWAWP